MSKSEELRQRTESLVALQIGLVARNVRTIESGRPSQYHRRVAHVIRRVAPLIRMMDDAARDLRTVKNVERESRVAEAAGTNV